MMHRGLNRKMSKVFVGDQCHAEICANKHRRWFLPQTNDKPQTSGDTDKLGELQGCSNNEQNLENT